MKKIVLIILLLMFFNSCKKDKNNPKPNSNTDTPFSWLTANLGENYVFNADTLKTTVTTQNLFTEIFAYDKEDRILAIGFEGRDTGTYIMGANGTQNYIRYLDDKEQIFSSKNSSGILQVTKLDTSNKRISGNFTDIIIRLKSPYDSIKVKNGKFENLKITIYK